MISIDFDGIASDLPDVKDLLRILHKWKSKNRPPKIKIIIKNRFFIFAPETFLGHLGGVGRLYLEPRGYI